MNMDKNKTKANRDAFRKDSHNNDSEPRTFMEFIEEEQMRLATGKSRYITPYKMMEEYPNNNKYLLIYEIVDEYDNYAMNSTFYLDYDVAVENASKLKARLEAKGKKVFSMMLYQVNPVHFKEEVSELSYLNLEP